VAGSAQQRGAAALLQHGSLLLEDDQEVVRSVLTGPQPPGPAPEAPLARLLGRPVEFGEAAAAIDAEFRGRGLPAFGPAPPPALEALAREREAQFRSDAWTWAR
jgi:lipoyl(octanoyl) transferase